LFANHKTLVGVYAVNQITVQLWASYKFEDLCWNQSDPTWGTRLPV